MLLKDKLLKGVAIWSWEHPSPPPTTNEEDLSSHSHCKQPGGQSLRTLRRPRNREWKRSDTEDGPCGVCAHSSCARGPSLTSTLQGSTLQWHVVQEEGGRGTQHSPYSGQSLRLLLKSHWGSVWLKGQIAQNRPLSDVIQFIHWHCSTQRGRSVAGYSVGQPWQHCAVQHQTHAARGPGREWGVKADSWPPRVDGRRGAGRDTSLEDTKTILELEALVMQSWNILWEPLNCTV